jgi:NADH/NAD ratio-sensing transcriptional regulator Rex
MESDLETNVNVIPDIVVGRLPIYLRALQRMMDEGRRLTSSQELGVFRGRKDLSGRI